MGGARYSGGQAWVWVRVASTRRTDAEPQRSSSSASASGGHGGQRGAERLAPSDAPAASPHKTDGSGRMRIDAEPEGVVSELGCHEGLLRDY